MIYVTDKSLFESLPDWLQPGKMIKHHRLRGLYEVIPSYQGNLGMRFDSSKDIILHAKQSPHTVFYVRGELAATEYGPEPCRRKKPAPKDPFAGAPDWLQPGKRVRKAGTEEIGTVLSQAPPARLDVDKERVWISWDGSFPRHADLSHWLRCLRPAEGPTPAAEAPVDNSCPECWGTGFFKGYGAPCSKC